MIDSLLIGKLEPLFPKFNKFADGFTKFSFSKERLVSNVKAKYALYKLNCAYSGNDIFEEGMTVEHIIPECKSLANRTIGNLILLENNLNSEAAELDYQAKKSIYTKSRSTWIEAFLSKNTDWDETKFEERALQMAKDYYEKVFGKTVN